MKRAVYAVCALAVSAVTARCIAAAPVERKLFAHYMGCWPAACGAMPHQQKNEARILAEQKERWATCGERI